MSWDECINHFEAKNISPDFNRAKSLEETAKSRIELINEINEKNCNFVFEDYYTSLLEIIQAKAFRDGFNIMNHICVGFYLKDKLEREDLFHLFDDLRYKRNSLTYYGRRVEFEVAKEAINKCKRIISELGLKE